MESDTSDKRIPLEEMSKDDVIKKYNNLLIIAKKAKQAKNGVSKDKIQKNSVQNPTLMATGETLEDLKRAKERECKLTSEIEALKEMLESFTEKQKHYAEFENKAKQTNDKVAEISTLLKKSDNNLAQKIIECKQLEDTLFKQAQKYCALEEKYASSLEKLDDFKENYAKVDIEKKLIQEKLIKYEKEETDRENLHLKYKEALENNQKLSETISQTEARCNQLSQECLGFQETLKNLPENWTQLASENRKLKKLLGDAEENKAKLEDELNFFGSSLPEFTGKSRDCAKLSENLLKEERENLKLMEEINDLKQVASTCKHLEQKLTACEEERLQSTRLLEEAQRNHGAEVKALEEKLEKEKADFSRATAELEVAFKTQITQLETHVNSCQKKLESLKKEKESLGEALESEKRRAEEAFSKLKALQEERAKCESRIGEEESSAMKELEARWMEELRLEKEKSQRLEAEKGELEERLAEKEASGREEVEKLRMQLGEVQERLEKRVKEEAVADQARSALDQDRRVAVEALEKLKTEAADYVTRMETLKAENENLRVQMDRLKALKEENKSLTMELDRLRPIEKENEKFTVEMDQLRVLREENESLTFEIDRLKAENESLGKTVEERQGLTREVEELRQRSNENECLKKEMETMRSNHEELVRLVRRKLEELLSSFAKIKVLRKSFDKEVKNKLKAFEMEQTEARQNIQEVVLRYVGHLHNGNSELLSEMNDMNQVLKERGETISKLEQLSENQRKELEEAMSKITNQSSKLAEKNKKLEEMEEEVGKAKVEAENKHKAMREMEEEMWRLKNSDNQGEALSTSTLSRADETARMMELEESFEERYTKLKVVAVKLKKKVTDLQKQVETERNNLITAESEYQKKINDFHNQIKSLRNIQTEYDRLQDILEDREKERTSLQKTLELAQQELTASKQQLEESKADREKWKSDRSSFEKIKKELTAHIGELKQTMDKQRKELSDLEKQREEMKSQLATKDRHIEEEREKHKAAILLLEEQKLDSKKHSVLELEIAAYEKTAEDLKKRLDLKEKRIKDLENEVESEQKSSQVKNEEISRLRSNITDEQLRANTYESQLNQANDELAAQRAETAKKCEAIKALEKNIAEKNLQVDTLTTEIDDMTKEKFKREDKFRGTEEKLCRQIHNLEEKIASLEESLSRQGIELDELKREYQAYKVRAQSVLRQSQKDLNPSKQQNALEELEQLKSTSQSLKTRLDDSSKKLQKLSEDNGTLQEEKKRLFGRVQELNATVTDLREENHRLKEEKQKENEEHAEILRVQKLQCETLAQCFQKETEELERKHETQVEELKRELEQAQRTSQIFFKPEVRRSEVADKRKVFMPVKPEKEILDVMLLEREECEGSESVDSISPQSGNTSGLIPLEQLLSESEVPDTKKSASEVNHLQMKLEKSENRIKHLTVLLSDAESDSARLTQLNEVLKEEIKRLERSLEREEHAKNFEYLKNVIVKFAGLPTGDEKLRLVPVLNTILKLSPEEEVTLVNSAKGIPGSGARGWGINLGGIWPAG